MTIQELIDRITFFNDIKIERARIKNIEFFQILSNCIAVGTRGKKNDMKEFNKNLVNLLTKKDEEKEEVLDPDIVHKIIKR